MSGSSLAKNAQCANLHVTGDIQADSKINGKSFHEVVYTYDFSADGGAVSTITLDGPALPVGAVVTKVWYQTTTILASGGAATVSLGNSVTGAAVYLAADTLANHNMNALAFDDGIQTGVAAQYEAATAAISYATMTIAVAALTAGVLKVHVEYIML